ncbi:MAG: efflux transporter outer membrane subunit [Proteobacteria bacterium]|nr:efflux transporter outer membrane subunit [Pseudomonadota bacterium]
MTPTRPRRLLSFPMAPVFALIALAPGACAVGPRYSPPGDGGSTSAAFHGTDAAFPAAEPPDAWWREYGDPVLDSLVDRALAGNPDLATAEARVQQARAAARVAGASFYPTANASGRVARDKLSRNGENLALIPITPPTTEFTDYRAGFDATWEIDLAGKSRHDVEAAVARLGSAEESRNDARLVVAAEVVDAYVSYHTAEARRQLAEREHARLSTAEQLVTLQQRAGLASESDLARARADRAGSEAALAPLEAEQRAAVFRLAALADETSDAIAAQIAGSRTIPGAPSTTPVGLPSELLRRRPDVRRAERDLAAATADVGSAVAAQFPRLSLVGDLGWDSVRSGDLTSAASRFWNVAPQLTLPLFAGGRLRSQAEAARAGRRAALAVYRATVLRALQDTETAIIQLAAERRREASLATAAESLARDAALERRRFEAGDVSLLEVLASERLADQAADQRVASDGALARRYAALGKSLGGGWGSAR